MKQDFNQHDLRTYSILAFKAVTNNHLMNLLLKGYLGLLYPTKFNLIEWMESQIDTQPNSRFVEFINLWPNPWIWWRSSKVCRNSLSQPPHGVMVINHQFHQCIPVPSLMYCFVFSRPLFLFLNPCHILASHTLKLLVVSTH